MRAFVVAALCAGLASPAFARPKKKVLITPIEGSSKSHPTLSAELTSLLIATAKRARVKHAKGGVGLDELLLMSNCSAQSKRCRTRLLRTVVARSIIGGAVSERDGTVSVSLIQIGAGAVTSDSHPLSGTTTEELVDSFEPVAARLFGVEPLTPPAPEPTPATSAPAESVIAPEPESAPEPAPEPAAPEPTPAFVPTAPEPAPDRDGEGGARLWTYGLIGVGGALVVGGVVGLVLANSAQNDVDDAPVSTEADLEALEDLESRAKRRYQLSYTLLATGAVATAVGVTLVILQRRDGRSPSVAVAPTRGGAAAFLGGSF